MAHWYIEVENLITTQSYIGPLFNCILIVPIKKPRWLQAQYLV